MDTWSNPYQPQIAALTQRLAQPAAPMFSPEEAAARDAENRRQQQLGTLGILSGDDGLGQVGGSILKNAIAARQAKTTDHGVYDPQSGNFSYFPEYQQQRDQAALDGVQQRAAAAQQSWDSQRQSAADRATLAAQSDATRREIAGMAAGARSDAAAARTAAAGDATDMKKAKLEDSMASHFDQVSKDAREEVYQTQRLQNLVGGLNGVRPDAATQQSIVILLNKFQDPGSVVREGEFNRVVEAQGLVGRAQNLSAKILKGEPLSNDMIQQINGLAGVYQKAAVSRGQKMADVYVDTAKKRGLDPDNVVRTQEFRRAPAAQPAAIDVGAHLAGQGGGPSGSRQVAVDY